MAGLSKSITSDPLCDAEVCALRSKRFVSRRLPETSASLVRWFGKSSPLPVILGGMIRSSMQGSPGDSSRVRNLLMLSEPDDALGYPLAGC